MKRVLVVILSFLYMASATGAVVHLHYCMGKLAATSLYDSKDDKCPQCGMKKSAKQKGCCSDTHKIIKADDNHLQAKIQFHSSVKYIAATIPASFQYTEVLKHYTPVSIFAKAPPPLLSSIPIYLSIRSIRI